MSRDFVGIGVYFELPPRMKNITSFQPFLQKLSQQTRSPGKDIEFCKMIESIKLLQAIDYFSITLNSITNSPRMYQKEYRKSLLKKMPYSKKHRVEAVHFNRKKSRFFEISVFNLLDKHVKSLAST